MDAAAPPPAPKPHHTGHRERLRDRARGAGIHHLPDYELLELFLFRSQPQGDVKPIAKALLAQVSDEGLSGLGWGEAAAGLRARVAFLRDLDGAVWPDLSDLALLSRMEEWLLPLLAGRSALAEVRDGALEAALKTLVPWDQHRRLDLLAPTHCIAPTGSRMTIDYGADGGPRAQVRVQELYGLGVHPMLAEGRVPLTLALLSPAHRPIQVTKDLPGFWRGSWKEVRSEMRGRYPRHAWPEDPANAAPTTRAKPRGT